VSEQHKNEIDRAAPKAEWARPGVDRLVAGGAEGSADITSDGQNQPS
jgi:hypothetical protein